MVSLSRLALDLRKPATGEVDNFGRRLWRRTARDSEESNRSLNRRTLLGAMAMIAVLKGGCIFRSIRPTSLKLLAEENRINIRLIPPERGQFRTATARSSPG